MTSKVLTGTYVSGYSLHSPVTSLTVAGSGYIEGDGIETAKGASVAYTVVNEGKIKSASFGIYLRAGGQVLNSSASSTIQAIYSAVAINGGSGAVNNVGTLRSTGGPTYLTACVDLVDGGSVINGDAANTKASIMGPVGVLAQVGYGLVSNFGTVISADGQANFDSAIYLKAGGRVTNGSATSTSAFIEGYQAINISGSSGFVTNFGTIRSGPSNPYQGGVSLKDGGAVENFGVIGFIDQNENLGGGVSLYRGGVVINGSLSDTSALLEGGAGVYATIGRATVENFATIIGGTDLRGGGEIVNGALADTIASVTGAISTETTVSTVFNFGSIEAGFNNLGAITLQAGGFVFNGTAADTTSKIQSYGTRVLVEGGAGTVVNFGAIYATTRQKGGAGVELTNGGRVVNGSGHDEGAVISGKNGVIIYGATGTVRNYGTILGGGGFQTSALDVLAGGSVINGSLYDTAATIQEYGFGEGSYAADLTDAACLNFGTIEGGSNAYALRLTGSQLRNGAAGDSTALIKGPRGVLLESNATITNFGTISGGTGHALIAKYANDEVIVEAGSTFVGAVFGGGGTLALASGTGALTGLSDGAVHVSGSMPAAAFSDFGTLRIGSAANFTVVGAVRVGAGDQLLDAGTLVLGGSVNNSGLIELLGGPSRLELDANTTLTGGGIFVVGVTAADKVYGASSDILLVNNSFIQGGGQLGAGSLALSNRVDGIIEGDVAATLIIATGTNTIANAGRIVARGVGSVTIRSAIDNDGRLETVGGAMVVYGPVSGTGSAVISGGTLSFAGAFDERVSFLHAGLHAGVLALAQSQGYANTIVGFSRTGATALDLRDIGFVGAGEASFAGTARSGILSVSDGAHTARLRLVGDFTAATFTAKSDGAGGTIVTTSTTMAPALHFIAAMSSLGASPAATHAPPRESWRQSALQLMAPRAALA